jgi:ParB family chromosome partitioning protein
MSSTRETLERVSQHVEESMGVRDVPFRPRLSPVPSAKDIGRRPLRGYGRLEIRQLEPDPEQPRTEFDEAGLEELAANIKANGQLHPIHVRWSETTSKWQIISGERRWRASQLAGLPTVDCFFHEQPLEQAQVLGLQLIENLLRDDLKPVEEARAFQSLMFHNGWTGKQVAESLHIPASKVSRALALLKLPQETQKEVDAGKIPARTAYELSKVSDLGEQRRLAQQAATGALTVADAAETHGRKQKSRRIDQGQGVRQTFFAENGWTVTVRSPETVTPANSSYHDLESALQQALDEVRLRLNNNIRL